MSKILLLLLVGVAFAPAAGAQDETLTEAGLPDFLSRYEQTISSVDKTYEDLASENLPLRDDAGQPLGRRHIENRRQTVVDLRQTIHQLSYKPEDLVLTATLLVQTEALADDLFDLSQIAYDNDREELGKRLSDLATAVSHDSDLIQSYMLKLAAEKQEQIKELEKKNQKLEQQLRGATLRKKAKSKRN
jgi:hypothetical protein